MQIVVDKLLTNYQRVNPHGKYDLLILHGWGQSSAYWQTILENLPSEISVIALDLPAFGSSQPLPDTPGVHEYATFVKNFIEKLKLNNITILGHSFGGQVAVDMAIHFPKLIKYLILVSPACIRNLHPTLKSQIASFIRPLTGLLPENMRRMGLEKYASKNYSDSNHIQRNILKKILNDDYSNRLKNISTPTSIIWGSEDKEIPYGGRFLAENITSSSLYVLYGADHSPHLSIPTKFLDTLKVILEKIYAQTS